MIDDKTKAELERKSQTDILTEVDVNTVNEGYVRFLDHFGLTRQRKAVAGCRQSVVRVKCLGPVTHRGVYVLQCQSRACPSDDWVQVVAQLDDMRYKLYRMFNAMKQPFFVWTADLTIASDLWSKVPRMNLARFCQIAYESMQEYFDWKWGFPVQFGMDAVPQFWHSQALEEGFYPHIHVIVPRLFLWKETGRWLTNVSMTYIEEKRLKSIWRRRVEEEYGESKARVAGGKEAFSCHFNYIDNLEAMDKRLRYQYRGIAWDYNIWAGANVDISKWDAEWVRWSLTYVHKRHHSYGLLSAKNFSPKSRFMQGLKLNLGTYAERRKARRDVRCPHCHEPVMFDAEHALDEKFGGLSRVDAKKQGLEWWRIKPEEWMKKPQGDFVPFHRSRRYWR